MCVGSRTVGTWSSFPWRPDDEFETDRRSLRRCSILHDNVNVRVTLAKNDVHIYYRLIRSINSEEQAQALESLSSDEHERAERLLSPDHRITLIAAHWLLRTALSRYADVPASAWSFAANAHGKPFVDSPRSEADLRFNLAHSEGLVACAVCRGAEIGIDVESLGRRRHTLALAARYFSDTEVRSLEALEEHQRDARFVELWTLKEAYVKAMGLGLSHSLHIVAFDLSGRSSIRFDSAGIDASTWQFALYAPTADHRIAVAATCAPGRPCRITTWGHASDTTSSLLRASQGCETMMTAF